MNSLQYITKIDKEFPGAAVALASRLLANLCPGSVSTVLLKFYEELKKEYTTKILERQKMIEQEIKIVDAARRVTPNAENDLVAVDKYVQQLFDMVMSASYKNEIEELDKEFTEAKELYKKMKAAGIISVEAIA